MRPLRFSALICSLLAVSSLPAQPPREPEHGDRPHGSVTFYEHANYTGASLTLRPGESLADLSHVLFSNGAPCNDRISSIRIEGGLTVRVYRDARFRGGELKVKRDQRDLGRSESDWNDAISSIRVSGDSGPPEPDRPGREDMARYDKIIERAYLDVLQRPVDPSGLRSYRQHMIEDRWSDQDVRRALRESEEFRQLAGNIVMKVYRDLLDRAPSSSEARMYRNRMVRDRWTEEDVRSAVKQTPEYRDRLRHGGGH